MYLQGKLNQNAHITLRAPEYWQQLNLSVKNLVKELKTFELPVSKMIQPSRVLRIFMASALCCCCYCLYTWISFSFLFFKHAALCSAVLVFVLAASFMHGYAWIFLSDVHVNVYMHAGVCQQKKKNPVCAVGVQYAWPCAWGGSSAKGIVCKWQRVSNEDDSYVCGLITINSPFDCNWCLNLLAPPPLSRPLVPPSVLSF